MNNNLSTEKVEMETNPKAIELIIEEISSQVDGLQQSVKRLADIEERLQGPTPKTQTEDMCEPSNDYLTMLNNQIENLKTANRAAEYIINNIEIIL